LRRAGGPGPGAPPSPRPGGRPGRGLDCADVAVPHVTDAVRRWRGMEDPTRSPCPRRLRPSRRRDYAAGPATARLPETRHARWAGPPAVRRLHGSPSAYSASRSDGHGRGFRSRSWPSAWRASSPALEPARERHHHGIGGRLGLGGGGRHLHLPPLHPRARPDPLPNHLICLAGGACLGVLFLIPLRRYFVREMHGAFPSRRRPRSPRCWSPARRAARSQVLLQATGIAGVYDSWSPPSILEGVVDLRSCPPWRPGRARAHGLSFDAVGFHLGLGYVMGCALDGLCAGGASRTSSWCR